MLEWSPSEGIKWAVARPPVKERMSYLSVDGGRLYYETAGSGRPLIMIHAAFLDSRMWDGQFRVFAKKNRVVRYDVRGFGRSSRPSEDVFGRGGSARANGASQDR